MIPKSELQFNGYNVQSRAHRKTNGFCKLSKMQLILNALHTQNTSDPKVL